MGKRILNFFKTSKIFYIGILPIIYLAINTGIYKSNQNPIKRYVIENHSAVEIFMPNVGIGFIHGILTFSILTILWIFIIILGTNFNKDKPFIKRFFILGEMSVDNIITKLFYTGIIVVCFWAYVFKTYFGTIIFNFISYDIDYSRLFTLIISYIITFAVGLILWKIICELLVIIFRCFEIYYESKKKEMEG
ncbi:MAG: hypothetical protein N4A68_14980 [Maledivibacter sp.]|jgi:hypothetical protein|nr:hypothetical protein [Maledivibacter sp.]